MSTKIRVILKNTWNYGQKAIILNCIKEDGECYYIVKTVGTEKAEKLMLHESQIEII